MIIHLLEMKNPVLESRQKAERGFHQCMKVMMKLREIYAAADFAAGFLDAALRKAALEMNPALGVANGRPAGMNAPLIQPELSTPPPENAPYLNATETGLFHQNRSYMAKTLDGQQAMAVAAGQSPPPTERDLESTIAMTPSASGSSDAAPADMEMDMSGQEEFDWNAMAGQNFDFDQWLQYPAEGVNNTDDTFMGTVKWPDASQNQKDVDGVNAQATKAALAAQAAQA
jgi:hypothetical protein